MLCAHMAQYVDDEGRFTCADCGADCGSGEWVRADQPMTREQVDMMRTEFETAPPPEPAPEYVPHQCSAIRGDGKRCTNDTFSHFGDHCLYHGRLARDGKLKRPVAKVPCGALTLSGTPCKVLVEPGRRCANHSYGAINTALGSIDRRSLGPVDDDWD